MDEHDQLLVMLTVQLLRGPREPLDGTVEQIAALIHQLRMHCVVATAVQLLLRYTRADVRGMLTERQATFLRENNVWPDSEEEALFKKFLADLTEALAQQHDKLDPPPDDSLVAFV